MADKSSIEWTDATWNPVVGCSVISPGCTNCYAMKMAARIERMTPGSHYAGLTLPSKAGPVWTGKLALAPDHILTAPLRWRRPRRIFVNSMSDLFHEAVPDEWIDRVFAVMALAPQHTFQVLTKRSGRMLAYCSKPNITGRIKADAHKITGGDTRVSWPLLNVWPGVSTEDQRRADERVPDLLATPAAVRWVSAEPLLGPLDIRQWLVEPWRSLLSNYVGKDGILRADIDGQGPYLHRRRARIGRHVRHQVLRNNERTRGQRSVGGIRQDVGVRGRPASRAGQRVNFSITEEEAAHKLANAFSKLLGTYIDPYSISIYPARGYWTHLHQDVQRFIGVFPRPDLPKLNYEFGSWQLTVSQIARGRRFQVFDYRGNYRGDNDFQIEVL